MGSCGGGDGWGWKQGGEGVRGWGGGWDGIGCGGEDMCILVWQVCRPMRVRGTIFYNFIKLGSAAYAEMEWMSFKMTVEICMLHLNTSPHNTSLTSPHPHLILNIDDDDIIIIMTS